MIKPPLILNNFICA